jgi:hypothetical protein
MTIVIVVGVLLLLAAGGGAYAYHAVARPLATVRPGSAKIGRGPEDRAIAPDSPARTEAALAEVNGLRTEIDRLRTEARSASAEVDAGLARLRERRDSVLAEAESLAAKVRDELNRAEAARRAAETAVELERQREREWAGQRAEADADVVAAGVRAERAETLAELYRRLTRVETTLAALTAPILLPGEPFEVPEEFPPEALRWENWKEVGESAYALGDYFQGRRLQLNTATAEAIAAFLTTLRIALTEQVYPNLKPLPTAGDAGALRAGLGRIAGDLTAVRARLEDDYRGLARMTDADAPPA